MADIKGAHGGLEWREQTPDGTSKKLEPEQLGVVGLFVRLYMSLNDMFLRIVSKLPSSFFKKAYEIARSEPRKVFHCLKVGVALTIVSLFYYTRPLYDGVGGNAMWAVMTVVVVFEYTVGQTLSKCINRVMATLLAGYLGIGVHWVASQCGDELEPMVTGLFLFLFASAVTFSRFTPTIKGRFEYGAVIFILTFSLVSVSGYRVEELLEIAHNRLTTIAIGTSMCIIISLVCFPVWAGTELHLQVHRNLEKLAHSLDAYEEEYFNDRENGKPTKQDTKEKLQGYKSVLNSKATEDSMANFARWEPAHGPFSFRHPWKQYLKITAEMRSCACCIESLTSCINPDIQTTEFSKKSVGGNCTSLSSHCSKVLKNSAVIMKTMTKSSDTDIMLGEMNIAVQELQNTLKSFPQELLSGLMETDEKQNQKPHVLNLRDIVSLATTATLLIEIAVKIEEIVDAIEELSDLAEFEPVIDENSKQVLSDMDKTDDKTMKVFQKV